MKKPLILLITLVAVAFLAITILKWRSAEGSGAGADVAEGTKQRIKTFWALYNNANTLRSQGRFAEAAGAYRKSLELDPNHEDSLYYLGTSLYELGDYVEAVATFRKMIEINPESSRAFAQLGNTLSVQAPGAPVDFAQARDAFLRGVQINREEAGPFLRLGLLDLNQGQFRAATENFRIAAGFGSPEGNFLLGYTLFLQKKEKEAAQFFRKALESYARERKVTARGVLSEGDVLPAPGKPLTGLEKTGLKSILFMYWTALRLGGYPAGIPKELHVQARPSAQPNFQALRNRIGIRAAGGRAAWADFDKDGRLDLVVAGRGELLALYHNQGERFAEVTHSAGLEGIRDVWDARWGDYDGDGYPDLYLIRSGFVGTGQNLLYRNNGRGAFTEVTTAMGLRGERATARAFFFDFDGDGRLDLLEVGAADPSRSALRLFRNFGNRFVEQTQQAGLASSGAAVDCAIGDYDQDGKPDLFVLYWGREAILFHNRGNGTFSDATAQAGLKGIDGQGFSTLFFDYDNDGQLDLLVTAHAPFEDAVRTLLQPDFHPARSTPRLFRNTGHGHFEEVTAHMGLNRCYGTMQALASDLDSDGWTDLLLVNGSLDAQRLEPSVILRNFEGKEFREWSYVPGFDKPGNFIGAALADFDLNGAPDVYFARNPILRHGQNDGRLFVSLLTQRTSHRSIYGDVAAQQSSVSTRRHP